MSRRIRVLFALLSAAAVLAAVGYAIAPEPHVADADHVVGAVPHLKRHSMALWIGDSFTAGTGSDGVQDSYPALVSDHFGWAWATDAEGGTGFLNNGHEASPSYSALPARIAADKREYPHPDLVVIDAGRDDGGVRASTVEPVARKYFDTVTADWPDAKVLVIAPYYFNETTAYFNKFRTFERSQTDQRGWYFIDPLGQGWISPANPQTLIFRDHIHPAERGQYYITAHLVADIEAARLPGRLTRTGPNTLTSS